MVGEDLNLRLVRSIIRKTQKKFIVIFEANPRNRSTVIDFNKLTLTLENLS